MRNPARKPVPAALIPILVLALLWGASGCGGDKEDVPPPAQQTAMVPGGVTAAAVDSLAEDIAAGGVGAEAALPGDGNRTAAGGVEGSAAVPSAEVPAEAPVAAASSEPAVARNLSTAGGEYSLQLGSFQNRAYAEQRAEQVRTAGLEPVIESADIAGAIYYRVLVRGLPDRGAAVELGDELGARLNITYLIKRAD